MNFFIGLEPALSGPKKLSIAQKVFPPNQVKLFHRLESFQTTDKQTDRFTSFFSYFSQDGQQPPYPISSLHWVIFLLFVCVPMEYILNIPPHCTFVIVLKPNVYISTDI